MYIKQIGLSGFRNKLFYFSCFFNLNILIDNHSNEIIYPFQIKKARHKCHSLHRFFIKNSILFHFQCGNLESSNTSACMTIRHKQLKETFKLLNVSTKDDWMNKILYCCRSFNRSKNGFFFFRMSQKFAQKKCEREIT